MYFSVVLRFNFWRDDMIEFLKDLAIGLLLVFVILALLTLLVFLFLLQPIGVMLGVLMFSAYQIGKEFRKKG